MTPSPLRDLRLAHGRHQNDLGVSPGYANQLEHGRVEAGPDAIRSIAEALGIDCPTVAAACAESRRLYLESLNAH